MAGVAPVVRWVTAGDGLPRGADARWPGAANVLGVASGVEEILFLNAFRHGRPCFEVPGLNVANATEASTLARIHGCGPLSTTTASALVSTVAAAFAPASLASATFFPPT